MPLADSNNRLQQLNQGWASDLLSVVPLTAGGLATINGPAQENKFWGGLILIVTTTSLVGSGTWKPALQMLLPDNSTYTNLWLATAAIATATTTFYSFYDSSALSDILGTEHKNIAVPKRWRIQLVYGGNGTTDTLTVRCDAYMLP